MVRQWTEDDIALLRASWYLYPKKMTKKELEQRFDRDFNAIRVKAQKLGLKSCARWSEYEIDYVRRYYLKKTISEIADDLRRTISSVASVVYREGIGRNIISNSRWSKKECKALEILVKQKKKDKEIARLIGRSLNAVKAKKRSLGLVNERKKQND